MRKLILFGLLFSPLALAQNIEVATNSLMRLPGNSVVMNIEHLSVADYGTLLVPANVNELTIGQLSLGHEARIAIVPSAQPLSVSVQQAELDSGSQILARGAPGTYEIPAVPARSLNLQLKVLKAGELSIDARGGAGTPGYVGLDGANGQAPGCLWGEGGRGYNGDNGGDGHNGSAGAIVRLQLPADFPAEAIKVRVDGGAGGLAGAAGKPGKGGESKGCLIYQADGGKPGRPGLAGQPGQPGLPGSLVIQHL